ncbi:MAG: CbiX/SirB N-terminal domain-containing protein [Pseudanabaenaceae cyanobacterium SKYGB_i_bin29]|nr:CbiX/SirB N-terminal domain-containing protein [Pseudanabaenaceae cyanobacterium SKYG29]MDW8420560.1 CbiX/SirB N-terminal domain-containing protein [Pseudanabaenaceae cyanobacterium SKYGB_i_bin29]
MIAYFVITHGSSSPRSVVWRQEVERCLQSLCPQVIVGGGCLEGQPETLQEQMLQFAAGVSSQTKIIAIPLFLLRGVHTQIDIPAQIPNDPQSMQLARRWLLTPLLGEHPGMVDLLARQFPPQGKRVLLCHGSKYPGATTIVSHLAHKLHAQLLTLADPLPPGAWVLPYFLEGSYALNKIPRDGITLLPSPFTPPVVAKLAQELAASIVQYS